MLNKKELNTDQQHFKFWLNKCEQLRFHKLKQYGACYDTFGVLGISLRLRDKISRITNYYELKLNNKSTDEYIKSDESIRDTLMDIVNYSIMGLMILDKEFKKLGKNERYK